MRGVACGLKGSLTSHLHRSIPVNSRLSSFCGLKIQKPVRQAEYPFVDIRKNGDFSKQSCTIDQQRKESKDRPGAVAQMSTRTSSLSPRSDRPPKRLEKLSALKFDSIHLACLEIAKTFMLSYKRFEVMLGVGL